MIDPNVRQQVLQLANLLELVENGSMTLSELSKRIGKSPQYVSRELKKAFRAYFRPYCETISEAAILRMIDVFQSPSERLIADILEKKNKCIEFPNYDEDHFWEVIKENLPAEFYEVTTRHCGYGYDKAYTFDEICADFYKNKVTRQTPYNKYSASVRRLRKKMVLTKIFNETNLEKINELSDSITSYKKAIKKSTDTLNELTTNYAKVDTKKVNDTIKKQYPEAYNLKQYNDKKFKAFLKEPISVLKLSTRSYNALVANKINTVGQLYNAEFEQLRGFKNIGMTSLIEIFDCIMALKTNWTKYI